jgi:hypothetical protein
MTRYALHCVGVWTVAVLIVSIPAALTWAFRRHRNTQSCPLDYFAGSECRSLRGSVSGRGVR